MALRPDLEKRLRSAIRHFWTTRESQSEKQGTKTGSREAGSRTAVTGGRQMDGFVSLVRDYLCESGLPKAHVYCEKKIELPGWYRPEKKWDLLIVSDGQLLAGIEFKSQVGSFGNNYNNRTEEAIGSATDIWAAYREGAFKPSSRPWLGYMMLLEEAPSSMRPVRAQEPHFKVFPEFRSASYAAIRGTPVGRASAARPIAPAIVGVSLISFLWNEDHSLVSTGIRPPARTKIPNF